ncbi:MAG: LysE family translocator [Pseudomonadota bacterium]
MLDFSTLSLFAAALAVTAGSPGPSIAALTARVLTGGLRSVLPFLAAMWIGEGIWLTCAVLGLSALASQAQGLFEIVKWLGIAYLLWLAWQMWHTPVQASGAMPSAGSGWGMFAAGLAVTLGNPKIMVFYVALLPSLVDLAQVSAFGWAELMAVMLAVLVSVDLVWALAADRARRLLRSRRAMRLTNRLSATAMGGAAAALAAR